MLPDRSLLDSIAVAVTYPLVGDRGIARAAADSAVAWLEEHQDVAGELPAGWLVAAAVERGLAAPVVPGRTHDAVRRRLADLLSDQPISGRVSLGLVGLCGYDRATAAQLSRRSVEDIDVLLAPFADLLDVLPELREPVTPRREPIEPQPEPVVVDQGPPAAPPPPAPPTPPPPPPWEEPGEPTTTPSGIWTTPPTESAAEELRDRPAPGRRLPISAGTTASLLAVIVLIVLITVPHGERPSFAEGSRLPPTAGGAAPGACDGATDRSALRLDVGAEANQARFFLPPGPNSQIPLVILIGDAGQSADDIASTSGLEGIAATQGFAVLSLDGTAKEWNVAGVADRADDVALVQQAIDAAQATGCVDSLNTVLVGFGRGGHLAAVVACRDTTRIAGLAMIRGPYLPPGCAPTRMIPVLIEADTTDAVIPFDGGWGSSSPSDPTYTPTGLVATRDGWADLDQCDPTSVETTEPSGVVVTKRGACSTGSWVTSRVSSGYGHAWPTDIAPALADLVDFAT